MVLLLATATVLWAQPAPTDTAINEAIRRQAKVKILQQKLIEAQDVEARKELQAAAKLYEDCVELVDSIGNRENIQSETAQTIAGLGIVRLELARNAQKRGDLREADTQVSRVLKVDPTNPVALDFKKANDKLLK